MLSKFDSSTFLRTLIWFLVAIVFIISQYQGLGSLFVEAFPDSSRYFSPSPIFSLENAGVFYSLFARIFEVTPGILEAQVALSTFAWVLLSFATLRLFPNFIGLIASLATLFIASQEAVTNWNNLLLSESVAISISAMWIASLMICLRINEVEKLYWGKLFAFFVLSALLILNRPQALIVILPTCLILLIVPLVPIPRKVKFGLTSILGFTGIVAIWRLVSLAIGSPFSTAYGQHLVEFRPPFTQYALEKAGCNSGMIRPKLSYSEILEICPKIGSLNDEHKLSFISWFIAKPFEAFQSFITWLENGATFVSYSSAPTLIDEQTANTLQAIGIPLFQTIGYFALVTVILIVLSGLVFGFHFSTKRLVISLSFIVLMLVYVFIAWGVDGIELPRHTLPVLLFVPLTVSFSLLYSFKQDRKFQLT